MIRLIVTYLSTALAFAAVDYVWLSQIGPKVYHPTLDEVLRPASDPVNLPRPDGRVDEWTRTGLDALDRATRGWVRVAANMSLGAYDLFEATGTLGEPEWPATPFGELLRLAFKDRFITDLGHPALRRLRGEV